MKRFRKLIIFNVLLLIFNIILFSDALIGLDIIGQTALSTARGVTFVFLSIAVFIYGNYRILFSARSSPQKTTDNQFETLENCVTRISEYIRREGKTFQTSLHKMKDQLKRMINKEEVITNILLQKFDETEMSYLKFQEHIIDAKKVMCRNTRSVLNRLYGFDEREYEKSIKMHPKSRHTESKRALLNEYRDFIIQTVDYNEDLLYKLDRLILELSKLNDAEELNHMDALEELDKLIYNTKWYK